MANTTLTMTCTTCGRKWTAGPTGNLTDCPHKGCGGESGAANAHAVPAAIKTRRKDERSTVGKARKTPH